MQAASEWLYIVPTGIYHVLKYVNETYHLPIYITENGKLLVSWPYYSFPFTLRILSYLHHSLAYLGNLPLIICRSYVFFFCRNGWQWFVASGTISSRCEEGSVPQRLPIQCGTSDLVRFQYYATLVHFWWIKPPSIAIWSIFLAIIFFAMAYQTNIFGMRNAEDMLDGTNYFM